MYICIQIYIYIYMCIMNTSTYTCHTTSTANDVNDIHDIATLDNDHDVAYTFHMLWRRRVSKKSTLALTSSAVVLSKPCTHRYVSHQQHPHCHYFLAIFLCKHCTHRYSCISIYIYIYEIEDTVHPYNSLGSIQCIHI